VGVGSSFYIGIDPVIARIGPLVLSWYVLLISVGVLVVAGWAIFEVRRAGLRLRGLWLAAAISIPLAVIFSKLLHVVDQWSYYWHHPGDILSAEGLTIWGAVIGGALGLWIFSRLYREISFAWLGDKLVPAFLVGQAVGRVGCTINGCCYGAESYSPVSVIYTNPHSFAPLGIPTLPVTVFEIIFLLLALAVLLLVRKRFRTAGSFFLTYLAFYGAWRLGSDFLRPGSSFLLGLHEAQAVGLLVVLVSVAIFVLRRKAQLA
jgi:phosphatidylglycerol---prolipoprotein diacylglyceryl transferase